MVGGGDEASDQYFFVGSEFSVGEHAATVDADVAEAAAGFFVAAGVEEDVLAAAFPPQGRPVRDVDIVGSEGFVNDIERESMRKVIPERSPG